MWYYIDEGDYFNILQDTIHAIQKYTQQTYYRHIIDTVMEATNAICV